MTTAPSISFAMLEVPAVEDTMEMASPYPGTVDDFDIDLDVMEEHISNADEDLMVADATPEPSHHAAYNVDEADDADMTDDVAERAMVDADNGPEMNGATDAAYDYNERYEAEMLEDDYEEDIDAPVTDVTEEVARTLDNTEAQQGLVDTPGAQNDEGPLEESEETVQQSELRHENVESNDADQKASMKVAEVDSSHAQAHLEPSEEGPTRPHKDTPAEDGEHPTQDTSPEPLPTAVKIQEQLAIDHDPNGASQPTTVDSSEGPAGLAEQHGQESNDQGAAARDRQLHPVKVLYQENEISLFPPREDDSSETFFVENEGLAYDGFDKMFESFRQVLGDHVGEHEVLIVDVDPLNIQLREDSTHLPQVSLHQILDIYLQLCRNDELSEPQALYLTLSTAPTLSTELMELRAAAKEGKGLSQIQFWEDVEEISSGDGNGADERDVGRPPADNADALNLQNSAHNEDRPNFAEEESLDVKPRPGDSAAPLASSQEREAALGDGDERTAVQEDHDHLDPLVSAAEVELGEPQQSGAIAAVDEGSYDSEAQQTESTATLVPAAVAAPEDDQSHDGISELHHRREDTGAVDSSPYSLDHDDIGDPGTPRHDVTAEVDGPHDDEDDEIAEHSYGDDEVENPHPVTAAADHEHGEPDTVERDGLGAANLKEEHDDAEYHAEESREDESNNWPEDHEVENQGAVDEIGDDEEGTFADVTETTEDVAGSQDNADEQFAGSETWDAADHVSDAGTLNDETTNEVLDENDDLHDDEEYVDVGYDEELDFGDESNLVAERPSQPKASSKRSREENEEVDEADARTPDLKRTRSS